MHIPTHQIHNVLNAYVKRLKQIHDAANGVIAEKSDNQINDYSVEEKRRLIINKISADIIERIARSGPRPRTILPHKDTLRTDLQAEEIRYHTLTKNGDKVSVKMQVLNSDFLIKQIEDIARKSADT